MAKTVRFVGPPGCRIEMALAYWLVSKLLDEAIHPLLKPVAKLWYVPKSALLVLLKQYGAEGNGIIFGSLCMAKLTIVLELEN